MSHSLRITAVQIKEGELDQLGKQIAVRLQKMRGYEAKVQEKAGVELKRADDHRTTIMQLLAEAKAKCDRGGFKAFKAKYCPDLSRSRVYELLAIGSGKKTLEESRTEKRQRVAKSRRKVSATSDVADKSAVSEPEETAESSAERPKAEYLDDNEYERFWKTAAMSAPETVW
jgi:hypothetical protein